MSRSTAVLGALWLVVAAWWAIRPAATSGPTRYRIAVIPKGTSNDFWKSVRYGAEQLAAERGDVEIIWQGPLSEGDAESQIGLVHTFAIERVSGICLAPLDALALVPAVNYGVARGRHVPTVIFDSGLDSSGQIVSYVATDNRAGGALAARTLAGLLGGRGNVIMLRYTQGSESTEQRELGFLETLEREFAGITVLSSDRYAGTTTESALAEATSQLMKYGDRLDGVFTVCEPNSEGMLQALINAQLAGKIKFMAFDPSPRLIDAMAQGQVHGIVLQDPVKMGYTAAKTLVEHLEGRAAPAVISTGEHVATAANMSADPQIRALLHPARSE